MISDRVARTGRRFGVTSLAALACLCMTATGQAQETVPSAPLTGSDVIALPGIGRVILVFLLVAALAVGIVATLRRVLPKFNGAPVSSGSLRVLNRVNLGSGLRVYTLQIENETVLLAEGRSGLALTPLNKNREQA